MDPRNLCKYCGDGEGISPLLTRFGVEFLCPAARLDSWGGVVGFVADRYRTCGKSDHHIA